MQIKATTTIGRVKYEFTCDEQDEMLALNKAAVMANPFRKCNCCKNDDPELFKLDSNKDSEGNTYVNVMCGKCGAKSKLGQYKTKGYFWHAFEKYVKPEEK